jgi:hypothetical protein
MGFLWILGWMSRMGWLSVLRCHDWRWVLGMDGWVAWACRQIWLSFVLWLVTGSMFRGGDDLRKAGDLFK